MSEIALLRNFATEISPTFFCSPSSYAPENMTLIRHIALNLLGRENSVKVGMKAKRLKAAWDNDYLAKVLAA